MISSAITLTTTPRCARVSVNSQGEYPMLAVGGEDKGVHVYPFGDRCRVAQLRENSKAVTAVCFDTEQRRVAAGSEGGSIKIFDIEKEQIIRSFGSGAHKAPVTSLDYHGFGEFICSASADTHMKVWDIRKKTYIQNYKGVPVSVDVVRCFPDGRLVATGCAEGIIRIYDLTAGKLRTELHEFRGGVTSIGFHPTAIMCFGSSRDGTFAAWELENNSCVYRSQPGIKAVDSAVFTPDSLIAVSDRSMVTVACAPGTGEFSSGAGGTKASDAPWGTVEDAVFTSASGEMMVVDSTTLSTAVSCCTVPVGPRPAAKKPTGPKRVYHPESAQAQAMNKQQQQGVQPPPEVVVARQNVGPSTGASKNTGVEPKMQAQAALQRVAKETSSAGVGQGSGSGAVNGGSNAAPRPSSMLNDIRQKRKELKLQQEQQQQMQQLQQQHEVHQLQQQQAGGTPRRNGGAAGSSPVVATPPTHTPSHPQNMSPKHPRQHMESSPPPPAAQSQTEDDIVENLLKSSNTMTSLLNRRSTQTKVIRSFWPADVAKALHHAKLSARDESDTGTLVDFLGTMQHQRMKEKITLETLPMVLDAVTTCMETIQTENSLLTCLRLTRGLNHRFQSKIEEGVRAASHIGVGVDIALEARVAKAQRAHQSMDDISRLSQQYVNRRDAVGEEARQLCSEILPISRR